MPRGLLRRKRGVRLYHAVRENRIADIETRPAPFPLPAPQPNVIDYVEIPSRDLTKTRAFFESFFAWQFTDYGPEYTAFKDGRLSGGFFKSSTVAQTANGSALIVFYSPQLEATRDRARELGKTLTRDIFSFPRGRRFQFTEPGGSEFAIWSDH